MDLSFDHFSSPSQLPSGPGTIISHVDYLRGLQIDLPASPLYPLQSIPNGSPRLAIYQNAGLIMSLLYSKLSRCFHFSKRKLQTLEMTCKAPPNQPTFPPSLPHSLTSLTSSLLALSHAHLSQARLASLLVFTHLQPLCWSFLCS